MDSINCDFFFLQNNIESQTISLVSMFSKQSSKLTSREQGNRFCCTKSSVMKLSSMELESSRLDFPDPDSTTQWNVIKPKDTENKMKEFHHRCRRYRRHILKLSPLLPRFSLVLFLLCLVWFGFVGFFFFWSLYGNRVYNAQLPRIELESVMLDLVQQNRVPHTGNVSLLNSFENLLTNEIVWVLVLFWKKKKNPMNCKFDYIVIIGISLTWKFDCTAR